MVDIPLLYYDGLSISNTQQCIGHPVSNQSSLIYAGCLHISITIQHWQTAVHTQCGGDSGCTLNVLAWFSDVLLVSVSRFR